MKTRFFAYVVVVAVFAIGFSPARADDKHDRTGTGPSPTQLTKQLAEANAVKALARIKTLAGQANAEMGASKDIAAIDLLAIELTKSLKITSRDPGGREAVIEALGHLRSKKGAAALKRIAFQKKVKNDRDAAVQAKALIALGRMSDPKRITGFEDQAGNRNYVVAAAAYKALGMYGTESGKIRRRVAEILIKRISGEFPRYSKGSGKRVSPAKRERWNKISRSAIGAMQSVCHEPGITDVANWEQWWKENKRNSKLWRNKKA